MAAEINVFKLFTYPRSRELHYAIASLREFALAHFSPCRLLGRFGAKVVDDYAVLPHPEALPGVSSHH